MDRKQAQNIIKDTFENKFDKFRFKRFIINLLNIKSSAISDPGVTFNTNQVPNIYHPFIDTFEKIVEYRSGEHKVDVLAIKLKKEKSIERARTMQRNFIAWYLRGGCDSEMKDAALAAFISPDENDWRFSLIKMDYSLGEDKKGRIKISEKFTPAKRWSFLVGLDERSHTAQSQLIDILKDDEASPSINQLEEAFNVEKVTKEFFNKYRELFLSAKEALDRILSADSKVRLDFEAKNINTVDFSKKLLGQIVFLYFLQKKGWFGVARDADWGTGPKNFLRELFEGKHGKYKNFYNDILEPLFYEALRMDRGHDDDYYKLFNCKIPFLNGGLFDPINNYDWVHADINLPDELFSNEISTKEGDTGTGILDVFDRYNFTVKEDEPLEKEVAVDPEMLGKVFENLLEVKDRKSKGTYYTPREIVHYMCQQSLINYLATELEGRVSKDDIEILFKYGEQFGENNTDLVDSLKDNDIPECIIKNAELIDNKLFDIKVCDPAVGSGAFLVGIMSEIVRVRNILSNYINDSGRTIYNFKRDCIENSLYGVDTDPGAVEIAKLRLWLSLVVDEEDIRDIKPLPNLDYKIVCGNSLMSIEKNLFNQKLFSELEKLKKTYFDEINPNKKKELKDKISKTIYKITNGHKDFDFEIYFSEVFHQKGEKGGFDVVIANPPYLEARSSNFSEEQKDIAQSSLKARWSVDSTLIRRGSDLLIYFYELGLYILNENGVLVFLTQNSWLNTDYGKDFQLFLLKNAKVKYIIDSDYKYFDSKSGPNINTIITIANRNKKNEYNKINFIRFHKNFERIPAQVFNLPRKTIEDFLDFKKIDYGDSILKEIKWGILLDANKEFLNLYKLLKNKGKLLCEVKGRSFYIGQGLNISGNFIYDSNLFTDYQFLKKFSIPIMTSDDGSPFELKKTKYFLIDGMALSDSDKNILKKHKINYFIPSKRRFKPFLILPRGISKHFCSMNIAGAYSGSFVEIYDNHNNAPEEYKINIWLFLNSSIAWLWREISGRKNLGGGLLKAEATDLRALPLFFNFKDHKEIIRIYDDLKKRNAKDTLYEIETEEHMRIDDLIFNYLGLSINSRKKVIGLLKYLLENRYRKSKT
jgi:hypothetical protein